MKNINEELLQILAKLKVKNANRLNRAKRRFGSDKSVGMVSNADLLALYRKLLKAKKIKANEKLEDLLKKRRIRTMSGVAPVAVLTKPYPCPGNCAFCPDEKSMPKSYLSNEPAVMRAIATKFNPYIQTQVRLKALANNGHDTDKVELIIMGGTWSYLPKKYRTLFVKRCFDACNGKTARDITEAHKWNEKAKHRIVAMTIETRPDYSDAKEIAFARELGATKVELGVQIADDKILRKNRRGHGTKAIIDATKRFKQAGFKVAYHLMPNLPGATPAKDLQSVKKLFTKPEYQPDFIKIYPTVVTKDAEIYNWWIQGKYKPYRDKQLIELLLKMKLVVPNYVRIIRLIRDIPQESILAGNKVSNLREVLQQKLKEQNKSCQCIRCREAKEDVTNLKQAKLFTTEYEASGAKELFFEYCSKDHKKLYAFLRLRLPDKKEKNFIPEIADAAMIREVHTYGRLIPLGSEKTKSIQHQGFGTRLTALAEDMARASGFKKMTVISGVGVRGYYKKLGYKLVGTYMIKDL